MIRILFVDDDPNVLSGLKRTMRTMRHEWEMDFIDDVDRAIAVFKETPFDVVVSDMRMPKMDGADFLERVKSLNPESIRVILSGHSDPALIMKSVGQTHQYLTKPCEPDDLKRTIARTYNLKSLIRNQDISQLVGGIDELPTIPSMYQKIVTCLQDPDASIVDIGKIIQDDIGMTTKILQLVNSAFFGLAKKVSSIERAVSYLGLDTIGALVLGHGVFSQFQHAGALKGFDIDALWRYCSECSKAAAIVSESENKSTNTTEEAFLSSMLHDVGKLILASVKPREYAEVLSRLESQSCASNSVELDVLGATHSEVGAYLIGLWGLPDSIVEAVAYHEDPALCDDNDFGVLGITHVASRLALVSQANDPGECPLHIDMEYLERVGLSDRLPVWKSRYFEELEKMELET